VRRAQAGRACSSGGPSARASAGRTSNHVSVLKNAGSGFHLRWRARPVPRAGSPCGASPAETLSRGRLPRRERVSPAESLRTPQRRAWRALRVRVGVPLRGKLRADARSRRARRPCARALPRLATRPGRRAATRLLTSLERCLLISARPQPVAAAARRSARDLPGGIATSGGGCAAVRSPRCARLASYRQRDVRRAGRLALQRPAHRDLAPCFPKLGCIHL
jgi:hypothetical protein